VKQQRPPLSADEERLARERRARKRKRLALIALAGRMDPVAARENREQRRRDLRRQSLGHTVERARIDIAADAERDAEERAAAKRKLQADFYFDRSNTPKQQRRYD